MPGLECSELASVGKFLAVYGGGGSQGTRQRESTLFEVYNYSNIHYILLFKVEKFDDIQINLFCVL